MNKLKKAFLASIPIAFGYLSLGFIAGAMVQRVGFNAFEITLISFLIFSGSAMFITANMLAGGINPQISFYLILTILITNLRNIMYSSALINETKNVRGIKKVILAQLITDETFALNKILFSKDKEWDGSCALYLNIFACFFGLIGNLAGTFFGKLIYIPADLGFFMMSSMFIVLIVLQTRTKGDLIMLAISILVSFIILYFYQGGLDLIIISLLVASIGYFVDRKFSKKAVNSN